LIDLVMPVMDGFEAVRELRKGNSGNKEVPVIALTAAVSTEVQLQAIESGINEILQKPYKEKELYRKIKTLLSDEKEEQTAMQPASEQQDADDTSAPLYK